jgi:hypothetical protein
MEDLDEGNPIPEERRMPLRDLRFANYMPTDRGHFSVEYLIALARARLFRRARTVEITFLLPFWQGLHLSCRKRITLTEERLPGGVATGKIVGYRLYGSGDGEFGAEVTIACSVGHGGEVTAAPGTPTYVDSGYSDAGWQVASGETILPFPGVTYGDYFITPNDDGIDFFDVKPEDMIRNLEIINRATTQDDAIDHFFLDVAEAIEALNAVPTQVSLTMKPVQGGPFTTRYTVPVSELKIPKTIDLEAA